MPRIAIVEDNRYLREELVSIFRKRGYAAWGITEFSSVEEQLLEKSPDLAVLDVGLPGKSGYELCKSLKARASFPILILTARDTLSDELTALGLGADDFLPKPCHPDRLLARVERLLQTYGNVRPVIQAGEIFLDTETYKLIYRGNSLVLPETEGKILKALIAGCPGLVSRGEIFFSVWGTEEYVDENILQVNMTRLRRDLAEIGLGDRIKTVRGQGYRLEEETP